MKKIRNIEIRDLSEDGKFLIGLSEVLAKIEGGDSYKWAVLPIYEPNYTAEEARLISKNIKQKILETKIAPISWNELKILAKGVSQFIDLVVIGSKDPNKLKYYTNDDEMFSACDIVIIMFDTSWWEVSCKDAELMKKFRDSFKKVKVIEA